MKTTFKRLTRLLRAPCLRNERGMLLVITMLILLVVSTLAAANLINAFLERSLAKNQNYASIALNAADGGIQAGLAWLNNTTNSATIPTTGTWTRPGDPVTRSMTSGGSYELTVAFKIDTQDGDCDGLVTDIAYFNRAALDVSNNPTLRPQACPSPPATQPLNDGYFAYEGSYFRGAPSDWGYPVITINSKGRFGAGGYREIEMDVARNKLDAQVEGAFTARAGVTATGSSNVDGRNHTATGALGGACGTNMPGVTVDEGVPLACDNNADGDCNDAGESCGNVIGDPCWDVYDPDAPGNGGLDIQKTPWGVLGISQADFISMFRKIPTSSMDMTACGDEQLVWFSGTDGVHFNNSSPCTAYKGILVVHNEGFDPDLWEAKSDPTKPGYDAAYANDPANKPAVFDMNGNVSWTGVIIADQVVKVSGNPLIRGGIISLASGGIIDSDITGNIDIEYSCEAVTAAVNQGYKTRLGWHRIR